MAGTVQSLFGDMFKTPEQIRQEQQQALMNEGRQSAGMLLQGGGSGLAQAIKGHAANIAQYIPTSADQAKRGALQAAGQLAGMAGNEQGKRALNMAAMSPEEQKAVKIREAMKGVDFQDQASVDAAVQKLQNMGFTQEATALVSRSDALQARKFEKEKFKATTDYQDKMIKAQAERLGFDKDKWSEGKDTRDTALKTAKQTLRTAQSTEAGYNEIAGDPAQLKALGFSDELVQSIADSGNKTAYHSLIKSRMDSIAEIDAGGSDLTADMKNFNELSSLWREMENLDPNSSKFKALNTRALALGKQLGALGGTQYDSMSKAMMTQAQESTKKMGQIDSILNYVDKAAKEGGMKSGWGAKFDQALANATGTQDAENYVRTKIEGIRNSNAINNLPPGVASDTDVALALKGELPADASPEQLAKYLRGIKKIEKASVDEARAYSRYMGDSRNLANPSGYTEWRYNEMTKERKAELKKKFPDMSTEEVNRAANDGAEFMKTMGYWEAEQKADSIESFIESTKSERDKIMGR